MKHRCTHQSIVHHIGHVMQHAPEEANVNAALLINVQRQGRGGHTAASLERHEVIQYGPVGPQNKGQPTYTSEEEKKGTGTFMKQASSPVGA